jgi:hypothetical protein
MDRRNGEFEGKNAARLLFQVHNNMTQYLYLSGWRGLDLDSIQITSKETWRIPEIILPKPVSAMDVIEVDPEYT